MQETIQKICFVFEVMALQVIEVPLSQQQKTFFGFFLPFLKCALNLEHFEKKDEYSSLVISKVIDSEIGGYLNV